MGLKKIFRAPTTFLDVRRSFSIFFSVRFFFVLFDFLFGMVANGSISMNSLPVNPIDGNFRVRVPLIHFPPFTVISNVFVSFYFFFKLYIFSHIASDPCFPIFHSVNSNFCFVFLPFFSIM